MIIEWYQMTSGHNHWQEDAGSLPVKTGGQILLYKLRLVQLLTHLNTAFTVVQTETCWHTWTLLSLLYKLRIADTPEHCIHCCTNWLVQLLTHPNVAFTVVQTENCWHTWMLCSLWQQAEKMLTTNWCSLKSVVFSYTREVSVQKAGSCLLVNKHNSTKICLNCTSGTYGMTAKTKFPLLWYTVVSNQHKQDYTFTHKNKTEKPCTLLLLAFSACPFSDEKKTLWECIEVWGSTLALKCAMSKPICRQLEITVAFNL